MNAQNKAFDLILFGATGFTGRLVAKYLADQADQTHLRWAIAGRNQQKLQILRDELGLSSEELPILLADSLDRKSLDALAAQTKVICSTVGPYARYGTPLVAACVEAGIDYCDLTGEMQWVRKIIDEFQEAAERTGARIVHCCGFDSIPSDLGVYFLQKLASERYQRPATQVDLYVWRLRGGLSGGTFASLNATLEELASDKSIGQIMDDPYALNPKGQRLGPDGPAQMGLRYDKKIGSWTAPFVMAAVNERVVRRSNALMGYPYGRDFRYREASRFRGGLSGALRAATMSAGLGLFGGAILLKPTRKLLERFILPKPGEGPSEKTMQEGSFIYRLLGRGENGAGERFEVGVQVESGRDPGYGSTSIMLSETALALAFDPPGDSLKSGILTPASALGDPLLARLQQAGITFQEISFT